MKCDKEGPCAPPCFTVTVVPAEETLEAFLRKHGIRIDVFKDEHACEWHVMLEGIRYCDGDASLEHVIDDLCNSLSRSDVCDGWATGKIIPGDIVAKIMASVK